MPTQTGWGRGTWGQGAWGSVLPVTVTGVAATGAVGNESVDCKRIGYSNWCCSNWRNWNCSRRWWSSCHRNRLNGNYWFWRRTSCWHRSSKPDWCFCNQAQLVMNLLLQRNCYTNWCFCNRNNWRGR